MAASYTWELIRTGGTFQSLVNTLLLFEYPGVRVFGRPGKDGAQDARSADDKTVYQYKYHSSPSISKTVSDAKGELTKITKYRQPAHSRSPQWQHATEWVAVTNLAVNPTDTARWDTEIVPAFAAINLKAVLWGTEKLTSLLTKYTHVADAYFEGRNRCFLSLGEAYDIARADELGESGLKVGVVGRDDELAAARTFLQGNKKLLCMHGPGGIGKSRLLLQIGDFAEKEGQQVLWGNEATMSNTQQWFASIPLGSPTLLLLDEPQDPELIRVLAEQLRGAQSQMAQWKVIIAVRSPNDPVLKAIRNVPTGIKAEPLSLPPLSQPASKTLALDLLNATGFAALPAEQKNTFADRLSLIGDRYPIWIAMAVNLLARDGNLAALPTTAQEIAAKYLDEVINRSITNTANKQQLQSLLNWLALYEEINIEEEPVIAFVAKQSGFTNVTQLHECLLSLVHRKFVAPRGINHRLHAIKPDVMREFVVRTWLITNAPTGPEPAPAARQLINLLLAGHENRLVPKTLTLIRGLARAEYTSRLQNEHLDFLSPLLFDLCKTAEDGTVLNQLAILDFVSSFDFARPLDVLAILQTMRRNAKPTVEFTTVLSEKMTVTHNSVVSQLAWPLFLAARYVSTDADRQSFLKEMAVLSQFEATLPDLPRNDGKRADTLLPRILSGEDGRYPGFRADAFRMTMELVAKLQAPEPVTFPVRNLTQVLSKPFLSLEQECTYVKRNAIELRRWFIPLTSPDGHKRAEIRTSFRACLVPGASELQSRLLAWDLLSFAHSSASRALLEWARQALTEPSTPASETLAAEIREDLKADLQWTLDTLKSQKLLVAELKAAREMWCWHSRNEKVAEIKAVADQCEAFYQQHPLVSKFHVFFNQGEYAGVARQAEELGNQIGASATSQEIRQLLQDALAFQPEPWAWSNLLQVAQHAGAYWETNKQLESFFLSAITSQSNGPILLFALNLLQRRLKVLRDAHSLDALAAQLHQAANAAPTDAVKKEMLVHLYGRPHPLIAGILTPTDLDFLLGELAAIHGILEPRASCLLLGHMHHCDWQKWKDACERICAATAPQNKVPCFLALLEAFTFLDLFRQDHPPIAVTPQLWAWLLDFLVTLPDLDQIGDVQHYHLNEFVQRFGYKDVAWLLTTIQTRIRTAETLATDAQEGFKLVPTRHRLTNYVAPLEPPGPPDPLLKEQISGLLAYNQRQDMIGYILPQYATDLDPHGVIVPELIQAQIQSLQPLAKDTLWPWTRFAGYYRFNSPAWRTISKAAINAIKGFPAKEKGSIFVSILPQEVKSSSYPAGEMDPRPAADLDLRKRELQEEIDQDLIPFRQWHVGMAQAEFDQTLASYNEENEQ